MWVAIGLLIQPKMLIAYWQPVVVITLDLYTRWVGQLGGHGQSGRAAKFAWRGSAEMALNAALVAAVFIGAAFVERGVRPAG